MCLILYSSMKKNGMDFESQNGQIHNRTFLICHSINPMFVEEAAKKFLNGIGAIHSTVKNLGGRGAGSSNRLVRVSILRNFCDS